MLGVQCHDFGNVNNTAHGKECAVTGLKVSIYLNRSAIPRERDRGEQEKLREGKNYNNVCLFTILYCTIVTVQPM